MKSLAWVLLIVGGTLVAAPARATDAVMPQPVTDYMPPPVTDETLPTAPAADTELPSANDVASPLQAVAPPPGCDNCPPAKRYDSVEVIKKIREIDRSRTVNTTEMAPDYAPRREAHSGYRVRSDVTLVNFVVHRYRVIEAPAMVPASEAGEYRPVYRPHRAHRVACKHGKRDRYGSCRPALRVRG